MSEEVSMRERGISDYEIELQAKSEELSNLRTNFTEYVESSRELEAELESSLEETHALNRTLSLQKVKAEQHSTELSLKLQECQKSLSRLQGLSKKQEEIITNLEVSKRSLEQLHEAGVEKIRQLEFAETQACEQRDGAEESYVLLLCEMEELRAEKLESEERLKAELTELQAELAQIMDAADNKSPLLPVGLQGSNGTGEEELEEDDRFPVFHMFILAIAVLSSAIALTSLFPYIGFMIMDVGVASSLDEAGYYSGAIASAMMFGRFASSFMWGRFADVYGRKPPLMIGCVTITTMSVMFGMSTSLWMMICSRVFLGLFNPIWGIAKTLVSELCSRKYEARAMGLTASCWSLGVVLGPVIGGFLANPAKLYPNVFADKGQETSWLIVQLIQYPYLLPNLVVGLFSFVACCLVYVCLPETLTVHSHSNDSGEAKKRGATIRELLNTPGVSSALTALFVLSLIDLSFSEIIPLWAIASVGAGGLGMEQQRIGFLMTFTGCLQVAYTMIFYPVIVGYLGRVQSFYRGQQFFIPFCLGITLLNQFKSGSFTQFVLLVFMFAIARACCSLGNSSIGLIVNRCVQKEQRASINGLSMGIGSMAKAVGPMASTYMFAWSINRSSNGDRRGFPLDVHMIFIFFTILSIVCIFLPLVYYETDEELEMAKIEMKKASNTDPEDDADSSSPLLDTASNNKSSYGSVSKV